MVCISYHSLEDRCVKHFSNGNFDKQEEKDFRNLLKVLYQVGKLIIPSYSEIKSTLGLEVQNLELLKKMKNLKSFLNIDFLVKFFKNWKMILFISLLAVIMISSGHSADKKILKFRH